MGDNACRIHDANKIKDFSLLCRWDFKEFEAEWKCSLDLSDEEKLNIFRLHENNMIEMYMKSQWGWDEVRIRRQMFAVKARFILIYMKSNKERLAGFVHFRFTRDYGRNVIYLYEIQIKQEFRKHGIGTSILKSIIDLAYTFRIYHIICTVFKFNSIALKFFRKNFFEIDPSYTSLSPKQQADVDYFILSYNMWKDFYDI
ncbi:hypothetical protein GJ496_005809 [Pomphorhynchus laevis]|nr:hypothetical protein GJ496_005809 [Pomphorhynchus laevis]